jgi:subtilase family serine protease
VSYCLWDTGVCNNKDSLCFVNGQFYGSKNLPNFGLGNFSGCSATVQGISVGGYDTYGMFYEGQYLTLPKGTKNGKYVLEIEVDPMKKYLEKDKRNNVFSMEIELKMQEK